MKRFLLELWSLSSRLLNVLAGGDADTTFSARAHIEQWRIERFIDLLFRLFGEGQHCRNAWLSDVERARLQIARHENRD